MNALMVLPFLKAGGTERQASYIVNYLHNKGYSVSTLAIENKGPFDSLFEAPVYFLNSKSRNSLFFLNVWLFIKFLRGKDIDILISRAWNSNILTACISMLTGKPAVLFLSGSIDLSNHSRIKKLIFTFFLKKASKIIAVSNASKQNCIKWLGIPENMIDVIHNGVDIDWVQNQSKKKIDLPKNFNEKHESLIFTGSLVHRKGLDILLKALKEVIKIERVNLIVVGKGDKYDEYLNLSNKLEIQSCVHFVGEKINPFPYINYGSIFVLPSRAEGFPNVLLEAMALKKPVIAADCETGPREIINGLNGSLVDVDDEKSLKKAILRYLEKTELRTLHGEKAQRTIEHGFRLDIQMKKIEMILLDLINTNGEVSLNA